jgi:hypothetical protein
MKKLVFLPLAVFLLGVLALSPRSASAHGMSVHAPFAPSHSAIPAGYVRVGPHSGGSWQFHDVIFSLGNSLFVSAELGETGGDYAMLRARTDGNHLGAWEQFDWYAAPNGSWYIRSSANGLYVSAELGYTGGSYALLRARTDGSHPGSWEVFNVFTLNGCDPVVANCQAIIQSNANGLFVTTVPDFIGLGVGELRATVSESNIGQSEKYDI